LAVKLTGEQACGWTVAASVPSGPYASFIREEVYKLENGKIVSIEDRIPKLKEVRKRKANRRLTMLLLVFFVLIACILYFLSPLSHIRSVEVEGNRYLSSAQISKASKLRKDASVWNVDKKETIANVKSLPEIKSVKVKVKLPNSIVIDVKEHNRMAYLVKADRFYPIMENGKILDKLQKGEIPVYAPVLLGYQEGEALNLLLEQLNDLPEAVLNSISEIYSEPTKTDKYHITMFMNDGFEVSATTRTLSEKLVHYPSIVGQLDPKVKGVIDLEVGSFFKAYEPVEDKKEKDTKQ
jgi:cell division protein FtsQ